MLNRFALSLSASLLFTCSMCAQAAVLVVNPSKDNTIYNQTPNGVNNSLGSGLGMFAGTNGSGASGNHRALVAFDISAIPTNAIVTNVQLKMVLGQVAGSGGTGAGGDGSDRTITLQRLLTDWGEGTAGSGTTMIGGTGQLFAAGVGDATWNQAKFQTADWGSPNTPGGDFSPDISSSAVVNNPQNTSTAYFWNATPTMLADVQGWVQNPATNFGWIIRNADETTATDFRAFWTKETHDSRMPELTVTYTLVPEPLSLGMAAIGALFVPCVIRRTRNKP